jgi:transcriptional regulator with GAF, ATPase, and Fis domain
MDSQALSASLRRLMGIDQRIGGDDDLLAALRDVVEACVDLFQVTGSGVMLADEMNMIRYVAASDGQGRLLEIVESEAMEGPCTDAFILDEVVATSDVRAESRWPVFRRALADQPELRAVLGLPLKIGTTPVGTLDVFRDEPHEWSDAEREALVRYGAVAQATLTSALAAHAAGEKAAQLQYALDYRVVIERGVGYLMARDHVDAVTAFNTLRTASRNSRTKIGQVAQRLLDTGELPDPVE